MTLENCRWFLLESFAVLGPEPQSSDRNRPFLQARLLLERYGVLVKEWYRRERELLPWYPIFSALKRLEWQGEIRRGYFVAGLSGVQFALERAVELLDVCRGKDSLAFAGLVSTADPALPFSGAHHWELTTQRRELVPVIRQPSNHVFFWRGRPVAYLESYGARILPLSGWEEERARELALALKNWLRLPAEFRPLKRLSVQQIGGQPAAKSQFARFFLAAGFERSRDQLILWPSGV